MVQGKEVFNTQRGVQYLIDRYLEPSDIESLRQENTPYNQDRFREQLVRKLERRSGGRWIPSNYQDELAENASAIIGSPKERRQFKRVQGEVDVYSTRKGREVYEDKRGRLRDYKTGRFIKKDVFEE